MKDHSTEYDPPTVLPNPVTSTPRKMHVQSCLLQYLQFARNLQLRLEDVIEEDVTLYFPTEESMDEARVDEGLDSTHDSLSVYDLNLCHLYVLISIL